MPHSWPLRGHLLPNQCGLPYNRKIRIQCHQAPRHLHQFKYQLNRVDGIVRESRVFDMYSRQGYTVEDAILVLNTIGGSAQFVQIHCNYNRMSPSSKSSISPTLTLGCFKTEVTCNPHDEVPPKLVLSPNAK